MWHITTTRTLTSWGWVVCCPLTAGYGDCNGVLTDGCEVDLSVGVVTPPGDGTPGTIEHCGACTGVDSSCDYATEVCVRGHCDCQEGR